MIKSLILIMILVALYGCGKPDESPMEIKKKNASRIFTLLKSEETGIDFVNKISDEAEFNILTYRNFYNGGGVAIGDINNDSLPDIYFTANQQKNKLYLNKGNFVFEDITDAAGVGGTKVWSTGVTMADVNGDGLLDIYVCNSGDVEGSNRENELFINNGDLTFSEKAKQYNLDNDGYGTHAAFFDYDLDGDLDCYILNNSFKDPAKIELYRKVREVPDIGGDKLMRNDKGLFRDVTTESGIYSSNIGFGLGVAISDINNDYLPDIYISNDFWERDYLYINLGDGTFKEDLINRINYCSISSMGADIADLNNDGSLEIFTTDMLPADNYRLKTTIAFDPYHLEDTKYRANFHYQMVQNCLHLNDGNGAFQEIALMAGVAATDWSWGALLFDFENDGLKDIFVSNGILKDIMSMDFREFMADIEKRNDVMAKIDYRDYIAQMPSTPLENYAFVNKGNMIFQNKTDSLGLGTPSFSNGSSYGDLDNDGDLDLVVNNINSSSFVYRNEANKSSNHFLKVKFQGDASNVFGIGTQVTIKLARGISTLQNFNTRGFQSSIEPHLLFGLGKEKDIKELQVRWPDGKVQTLSNIPSDRLIMLKYENAREGNDTRGNKLPTKVFEEVSEEVIIGEARHFENRFNDFDQEILLTRMLSTEGPRLITGDVNNDKRSDFILLGGAGDPDKLFVQNENGKFNFKASHSLNRDAGFESTCGALFDQDGDGDLDLMIGSGGNQNQDRSNFAVRFYQNDGNGNFKSDPDKSPPVVGNFSTLKADDIDNDGDIDVFLGARVVPGNYGLPPQSYLFMNDKESSRSWFDVAPPSLGNIGMVTDASWADIDKDGDKDLVVVGDWMSIYVFKNEYGLLKKEPFIVPNSKGWWNRVESSDLDNDGDLDFVVGNWGLNTKFKASVDKPVVMYVNDFDGNGKSEFIINWYAPLDSQAFPFSTKPELTSQLPGLRRTILKYEDYANKTYDSLFPAETHTKSLKYEVNFLESAILWNEGKSLKLEALPNGAQISPVFGILLDDLDEDGNVDIWLGGNFYALKPQVGRHDASKGVLLIRDSLNTNNYYLKNSAGPYVDGEVRDVMALGIKGNKFLFVARNNNKVLVFQRRK